jgi:hypothetical protein
MRSVLVTLAFVLLAGAGSSAGAAEPVAAEYVGIASALDDGRELYREQHFVERDASGRGVRVVLYVCPDGRAYARKRVTYSDWAGAPAFELLDARDGWLERVARADGALRVTVRVSADGRERSADISPPEGLVVDAGFDDFVRLKWDRLSAGERVDFAFLVPSRLAVMRFKVKRHMATELDGEAATVIRLSLGAWYGFLLPHIDVTYRDASRRLGRFEGLTNQRQPGGEHLMARIDFPADARKPLTAASLDAAQARVLDGTCDGS